MSTSQRIGFGKKIRIEWLIEAIKLRAHGSDFDQARVGLESLFAPTNPGKAAISKILSSIRQVVFQPDVRNIEHTMAGIGFALENPEHALCIAWGLSLTSYSFVATTAETVGRLLKLQPHFTGAELCRRLAERLGEREFVNRAARYNLSSFLDWGVVSCEKKRLYSRAKSLNVEDTAIWAWLIEAVLFASGQGTMPFSQAASSPLLFPFSFAPVSAPLIIQNNPRLQLLRQSLNEEFISLIDPSATKISLKRRMRFNVTS